MNIIIGKYRVTSSKLNIAIHEAGIVPAVDKHGKANDNAGEEILRFVGFYGNLKDACAELLRHDLMTGDAESVEGLLTQMRATEQKIVEALLSK